MSGKLRTDRLEDAVNGLYAMPRSPGALKKLAAGLNYAWIDLDLATVIDKVAFLQACQQALGLPEHFGANWDALNDCIQDLSWRPAPGYVICIGRGGEFSRKSPDDFATALEIVEEAAEYWSQHEKAFIVLLDAQTRGRRKLKQVPFA